MNTTCKKMDEQQINRMFTIISEELGIPIKNLGYESDLRSDLQADSLKLLELSFALEQEFGVVLLVEDMSDVNTIRDLQNTIESKLNQVSS